MSKPPTSVLIGLLAAAVGLGVSPCAPQNDESDCEVGAESCACTTGGACNEGLTCLSNVCVNPSDDDEDDAGEDHSDAGDGSKDSTGSSCESFCEAPADKCGLSSTVQGLCVDDCNATQANLPYGCESVWFAALACASKPSVWQCTSDNAVRIGCEKESQASEDCASGGDDGTGQGGLSAVCTDCLNSCRGVGGCCTGKGCICELDCQPTSCPSGASLCCDYTGYCICATSCSY